MKTLLALALTIAAALSAPAEVVIYTQSYSITATGSGATVTTSFSGYLIFDTDGNVTQLDTRTILGRKKMRITPLDSPTGYMIGSGVLKQQFVLVADIAGADYGSPMMKGATSLVNIGTTNGLFNNMQIAKTLTLSGFAIGGNGDNALLNEFKGTFTFDSKNTIAANKAGNDTDATISVLKTALAAKGYTLVVNWGD